MADPKRSGRKRQRLSGSEYKKIRLIRESAAAKQKDAILKFTEPKLLASTEAPNDNEDSSSDHEEQNLTEEFKFGTEEQNEYSDNEGKFNNDKIQCSVSVINCVDCLSDKPTGRPTCTCKDVQNVNAEDAGVADKGNAMVVEDDHFNNMNDMVSTDPSHWPAINDRSRVWLVQCGPYQHNVTAFPLDKEGRKFSSFHFNRRMSNGEQVRRSWLIYSNVRDAVYCFCCKLFCANKFSLSSNEGCRDWKNMSLIIKRHETSTSHINSYQDWKELELRIKGGTTVDDINQKMIQSETQHWKQVIERIITLIKTLAGQNLALRGTCEKLHEANKGNFLAFIEFLGNYDPVMKEHIRRITSTEIHNNYLGKHIQNEIIQLLSDKIKRHILTELKRAKYYSIILDCTPDISHKEQMTVIFRFVSTSKSVEVTVAEHFVDFLELNSTTGANMTEVLFKMLQELDVNIDDMRGQCYDNGANMCGQHNGVQAKVREKNRRAFFVPCSAHSLNLVLNDAANCCLDAVAFFDLIQCIYVYFSASTHRWDTLVKHTSDFTVKPLSATRWESRVDAVRAIRFQIGEVYDALLAIAQDNTLTSASGVKSRSEAKAIASKMVNFKFVCSLVVWYDILFEINVCSKCLQSATFNLPSALKQLESTKLFLQEYRSDTGFAAALEKAKELATELEIDGLFPREEPVRIRRKSKQFQYESRDDPIMAPEHNFKVNFFNQIVDTALQAINERFIQLSEHNQLFGFLYNIGLLNLQTGDLLKQCKELQLALTSCDGQSDVNAIELCEEIIALRRRLNIESCDPRSVLEHLCKCDVVESFPNLYVALRILLTLPITVASAERSFSKLKLIKTYLRSQMSQARLVGLATISIEKEIADQLNMEEVIQEFAALKARKVNFS